MLNDLLAFWKGKRLEATKSAIEEYRDFESKIVEAELRGGGKAKIDGDQFAAVCEELKLTPSVVRERVGLLVEMRTLEPEITAAQQAWDTVPKQQAHYDKEVERVNKLIEDERRKVGQLYQKLLNDSTAYATFTTKQGRQREIESRLDELLPPA